MVVAGTAAPKAPKAPKAHKAPASHPPFAKMIIEAIAELKEKGGSSRQAILKYIKSHYNVDEKIAEVNVRRVLVSATAAGRLVRVKGTGASGSFKISQKPEKPASAKRSKRASTKPKAAPVKKSPAVKKVTPKPKKAPSKPKKAAAGAKPKKAVIKKAKPMRPKKPAVKKTPKKAAVAKK
ncbi:hypothetical protein Aperf_G00000015103 [Anoplocephala perfoliata]